MQHNRRKRGFTIVELLIVVVVIAILAAITLVTYSGIQQRANNAAIIDAASKSLRIIQAYIAANDKYPSSGGSTLCITSVSGCQTASAVGANATFDANVATIGSLPRSIPASGGTRYGIVYAYDINRQVNAITQPVYMYFWLNGAAQQCGMSVAAAWGNSSANTAPSVTGYTLASDFGATLCVVNIPGPTA